MAQFCREAAIARAVLWEARRGFNWTDPEIWGQIMEQIERVEAHDGQASAPRWPVAGDSTPTLRPNHRDLGRALSEACDPLPEDRSGPSRQKQQRHPGHRASVLRHRPARQSFRPVAKPTRKSWLSCAGSQ
jgi:hypothetical protein